MAGSFVFVKPKLFVRIGQLLLYIGVNVLFMKVSEKKVLSVRCPTCGAKPGEKCELSTGLPRTDAHRDRRLAASDKVVKS